MTFTLRVCGYCGIYLNTTFIRIKILIKGNYTCTTNAFEPVFELDRNMARNK